MNAQKTTHEVLILFDEERGRFKYVDPGERSVSRDPLYVLPGDVVEWRSEQGAWAVHLGPLSPFDAIRLRGGSGKAVSATVREDVPRGKYPYFVAVYVDGQVWTDDPDNVVGPY